MRFFKSKPPPKTPYFFQELPYGWRAVPNMAHTISSAYDGRPPYTRIIMDSTSESGRCRWVDFNSEGYRHYENCTQEQGEAAIAIYRAIE